MKHILSSFIILLFFIGIFLFLFSKIVHGQSTLSALAQVNLSDAIYADLAVRGYLNNVSMFYSDGKAIDDTKLNENRHWIPASTVKLFAAMYANKLIAQGKLDLSDTVNIDAKNEAPTELVTDKLPTLFIGDTVTIDRLIRQMITQSDNTAFNQLLDLLGRDNITRYIQSLGLTQSHVGSKLNLDDSQTQYEYEVPGYGVNSTTAEDYAKAFLLIKNNKIPGSEDLYTILKQQEINNMIPLFLPKTVVCAHKTGDLAPLYHDGGICQDKKHSYVLTIFTNAGDPNLLAHLSEIVYTKNYQLVGQSLSKNQSVSENVNQTVDELVMNPPKTSVLGTSTSVNFPIPEITVADLGIKASDLSLVLSDNKLPKIFIPADSPLHAVSDAWQITKILFAPGKQARMAVNLQTAELRLAEAKDLLSRGKIREAQALLGVIQNGLNIISKDSTVQSNAAAQTTIQAISETKFSLLGSMMQKTSGDGKLALIKQIATQAKETIQHIQPNTPEAINATSPTQKPLIATIVNSTPTEITVKTAGGQQITVPINSNAITIQEKLSVSPMVTPEKEITGTPTPPLSPTGISTAHTLAIGTTIALVGSTVKNHFSPSLILTNVPKELAAPQPVTVSKVDTVHNRMVVEENGVYTQVNINKNTTIKGADTNIALKSIHSGDVVVVHGAPLKEVRPPVQPTTSITQSVTKAPSPAARSGGVIPTSIPVSSQSNIKNGTAPATQSKQTTATAPRSVNPAPPSTSSLPAKQPAALPPSTNPAPKTPPVIQSTSIQVIEKKSDVQAAPQKITQPKPKPEQKTQSQPQPQSQPAENKPQNVPPPPAATSAPTSKSDDKKK